MLDYISMDRCTNPMSNLMDKGSGIKKANMDSQKLHNSNTNESNEPISDQDW